MRARKYLLQRRLRLFRRRGFHPSHSIADPVDMSVNADRRSSETEPEHEVCGLRSDPGERGQLGECRGNLASVPVDEQSGYLSDLSGFSAVESCRKDESGDLCLRKLPDLIGSGREGKESPRGGKRHLILRAERNHCRNENVKWRRPFFRELRHRGNRVG